MGFYLPYAADPMLIIYPLNLKGYMISMGSATYRGVRGIKFPLADSYSLFLKLQSISICKIVHVRNTHVVFSCCLHFSSDLKYNVRAIGIYRRLN